MAKIVDENALSAIASDIKTALSGKANSNDVYPKSQTYNRTEIDNALDLKADKSELYNVYPTDQESGSIVHITDGADNIPVKSLESEIVAVESGSGEKSPTNPYTISGFDSGIITVTDNDQITNTYTFAFGQTVYGGYFDNKGNLVVTYAQIDINSAINNRTTSYANPVFYGSISGLKPQSNNSLCECFNTINGQISAGSFANISSNHDFAINSLNSGSTIQVFLRADEYTDVASLKSAVGNSKIIYELATPITLSITSQDIPTLLGENNIFSDTGDVDVIIRADIGLYIDKKISSLAQA